MKKVLVVYFLTVIGQAFAQCTILLDFTGLTNGKNPYGSLISDGIYLYGTTHDGGTNNFGTVFRIKTDGSSFTKLLDFVGISNGRNPSADLTYDGAFLYGTTAQGGTNDSGTVFKMKPDGSGFLKLVDFNNTNGKVPNGSLYYDGTYLYGSTYGGGVNALGTLFKLKPDGSGFTTLLNFSGATNGRFPGGSLISDGTYLYGTTFQGGANDLGTIFKIKPDGSGYIKLLDFSGTSNGQWTYGSFISDGTFLYGMTYAGGTNNLGTLFKIMPDGSSYSKLLDFDGASNGGFVYGNLIFDGTFLYGMTDGGGANGYGTIFKIKPDGTGYTKLMDFDANTCGSTPHGSLFSDGTYLYGTTYYGGSNNDGVVFKLDPTGIGMEQFANTANRISVFPNPTNGHFSILTNSSDMQTIDIFDVNGRQILSKIFIGTADINANDLDNGVYSLTIKNNAGIAHKKIIIAR